MQLLVVRTNCFGHVQNDNEAECAVVSGGRWTQAHASGCCEFTRRGNRTGAGPVRRVRGRGIACYRPELLAVDIWREEH